MENIGYILLGVVATAWFIALLVGMVAAFPFGIFGLLAILGFGFLFAKVIKERMGNKEDKYYSENVDK
jgi:type III secretory pathway component EscV